MNVKQVVGETRQEQTTSGVVLASLGAFALSAVQGKFITAGLCALTGLLAVTSRFAPQGEEKGQSEGELEEAQLPSFEEICASAGITEQVTKQMLSDERHGTISRGDRAVLKVLRKMSKSPAFQHA